MAELLNFLANHSTGIFVLFLSLVGIVVLVQWLAWMFQLGRFGQERKSDSGTSKLRFVAAELFVSIINEFRHLLALVVVTLFALMLVLSMWPGLQTGDVQALTDGLEAVAAVLGGLIGSIIGYYFGESAATQRGVQPSAPSGPSGPPVQQPAGGGPPTQDPAAAAAFASEEGVAAPERVPKPAGLTQADGKQDHQGAGEAEPQGDGTEKSS